jgi:hypothetical protein
MIHHFLDTPQLSYIVGFLQSDGHHQSNTRNRGKITVELQAADRPLLEAFQSLFPMYSSISERTRDTNFKEAYTSCCWSLFDWDTRLELERLGVPVGAKSETVAPPSWGFSQRDYFRGLVDGDGSLGMTGKGWPFVSLTTKSDAIATSYVQYLGQVTGSQLKQARRNRRDNIFNLMVQKEDAQKLAHALYENSTLRLGRKHASYLEVMQWARPEGMARRSPKNWWSPEQDAYIKEHSLAEAEACLGRSKASIQMRLYRLAGKFLYSETV